MSSVTRAFSAAMLLAVASQIGSAQSTAKGTPSPAAIHPTAVRDSALVRLFSSVRVLGERVVGNPRAKVRVIESWGGSAERDCDCLLSQIRISINLDGEDLRVYQLPELLDPTVFSITTEQAHPVIYMAYGPRKSRRRIRVEILSKSIHVTDGARR